MFVACGVVRGRVGWCGVTAPVRPVIKVVRGVCPVPKTPGASVACGEPADFFACGWRCAAHKPGRRP